MSKLIWHITMSTDGFIAGPDDSMDWAFGAGGAPNPVADDVLHSIGAILGGRRWWEVATAKYDGLAGVYGGSWSGPVVVLTHHPDDAPPDPSVEFVSDGLASGIEAARAAAAGKDVVVFGATTARQCIEAGVLDEIVIHLVPVLVGGGIRLWDDGAPRVQLNRTLVSESGGVVDLRYDVVKMG